MSQNTNTLVAWKAICTGAQDLLASYASVPTGPYPRKTPKTYLSFPIEPFAKNMHEVVHCLSIALLQHLATNGTVSIFLHIYYFGI